MNSQPPFLSKPLHEMSEAEWESLCDGCGLCCQHLARHPDTGEEVRSNVACMGLDLKTHRCRFYAERHHIVPTCLQVTPDNVTEIHWLPESCGYRCAAEGRPLPDWHPLISGDAGAVHNEAISKRGELVSELVLAEWLKAKRDGDEHAEALRPALRWYTL
jgi:uncharacterized cysteine cluster protein YcgN (CxxCxxCC family)